MDSAKNGSCKIWGGWKDKIMELEIDVREKDSRKESAYQFFINKEYEVSVRQLPVGDFIFDKKIVFEYKTAKDMIQSIMDGRVFRQAKRMRQYPYHYVIVVGNVFDEIRARYSDWENPHYARYRKKGQKTFTINNYIGGLATLYEQDKVIHIENEHQAFTLMYYMSQNILKKDKDAKAIDKPVCKMTDAVATFLCCIDGVSTKTALLIKNHLHLKTLKDLLEVEYDDLIEIKGIGSKTAKKIVGELK